MFALKRVGLTHTFDSSSPLVATPMKPEISRETDNASYTFFPHSIDTFSEAENCL